MRNSLFISSSKRIVKRVAAIILLTVICISGWRYYCKLVQYPRENFYEFYETVGKQKIDVLCVGSSHVYCGINPVQLYDDYGIAAYDLAAGSQAIWYSYYYIKQALKTQTPKVIVLDVYTLTTRTDYFNEQKAQANLINMPISYIKWQALEAAEVENKLDIFWGFPITHTRYSSLERDDYDLSGNMSTHFLGYYYTAEIVEYEQGSIVDVRNVDGVSAIPEKAEEYLRKCIELCQEKGIEIVLTNTPWPDITEEKQEQYNYIARIAEEYDIPFLNGCLMNEELGMDYTVDSMGDGGHLNYSGVTKWTGWLGNYLVSNYELIDRRGDSDYEVWEYQTAKLAAQIRKETLTQANSVEDVMQCLRQMEGLCCVVEIRGNYLRDDIAVPKIILGEELNMEQEGVYIIRNGQVIDYAGGAEDYNICVYLKNSVLNVSNIEGNKFIMLDGAAYNIVNNGFNILVFDEFLNKVVGKIGIDADNGYELVLWKS